MADPDFLTSHPSALDRHRRRWTTAAKTLAPSPILTTSEIVDTIALAAAIDRDLATVVYQTICTVLATAIRNRKSCRIEGFGTFKVRRATVAKRLYISFKPEGRWWGWWMPVLAYEERTLTPIGVWDGRELLPFGHPDNPYAAAEEVPYAPDWAWQVADPLPGEPSPQPYPHPVRTPRKSLDANYRTLHEIDPAERRRIRRAYYRKKQARLVKEREEKSKMKFNPP